MRFNIRRTLVASMLVLGMAGTAQAGTLHAGPLVPGPNQSLLCVVANVSSKPIEAVVEIVSGGGITLESLSTILQPGADFGFGLPFGSYCRFTVPGSRANVIASASIIGPDVAIIAAVPAQ